jgi:hypothetical protein
MQTPLPAAPAFYLVELRWRDWTLQPDLTQDEPSRDKLRVLVEAWLAPCELLHFDYGETWFTLYRKPDAPLPNPDALAGLLETALPAWGEVKRPVTLRPSPIETLRTPELAAIAPHESQTWRMINDLHAFSCGGARPAMLEGTVEGLDGLYYGWRGYDTFYLAEDAPAHWPRGGNMSVGDLALIIGVSPLSFELRILQNSRVTGLGVVVETPGHPSVFGVFEPGSRPRLAPLRASGEDDWRALLAVRQLKKPLDEVQRARLAKFIDDELNDAVGADHSLVFGFSTRLVALYGELGVLGVHPARAKTDPRLFPPYAIERAACFDESFRQPFMVNEIKLRNATRDELRAARRDLEAILRSRGAV